MPPSEVALALSLGLVLLALLAPVGLMASNIGISRSRGAAQMGVAVLGCFAAAVSAYVLAGARIASLSMVSRTSPGGSPNDASRPLAASLLQLACVAIVALVPLGTGADRWRLKPSCISAAIQAAIAFPCLFILCTYPGVWPFADHPAIDPLRLNGGVVAMVHVLGGLVALAVCWQVGPRRGKYSLEGTPTAIPAHHVVFVLLGSMLSLVGFAALYCASALLFDGTALSVFPQIVIDTFVSASAGALAALFVTDARFGKPDASLVANGWMAGIVAASAGGTSFTPYAALAVGAIAGVLIPYVSEWLEVHLRIDDPAGAISIHAVGGLWSLLAAGVLAGEPGQLLLHLVAISTLLGLALPFACLSQWMLGRVMRQRVNPADEPLGMDLIELGAGAYPEFVTHSDEFTQR